MLFCASIVSKSFNLVAQNVANYAKSERSNSCGPTKLSNNRANHTVQLITGQQSVQQLVQQSGATRNGPSIGATIAVQQLVQQQRSNSCGPTRNGPTIGATNSPSRRSNAKPSNKRAISGPG